MKTLDSTPASTLMNQFIPIIPICANEYKLRWLKLRQLRFLSQQYSSNSQQVLKRKWKKKSNNNNKTHEEKISQDCAMYHCKIIVYESYETRRLDTNRYRWEDNSPLFGTRNWATVRSPKYPTQHCNNPVQRQRIACRTAGLWSNEFFCILHSLFTIFFTITNFFFCFSSL